MIDLDILRQIPMFSQFSAEALGEIAVVMQLRCLAVGEVLFDQGESGDELFIVQEGSLAIYVPGADLPAEAPPLRVLTSGEVLGEMALIDRKPRSLSARALTASGVLVLSGDEFRRLLQTHPEMALYVMSGLNDRIRYTLEFIGEMRIWIKRVAEGTYDRQFTPQTDYEDHSIAALVADFAQMAIQVQQREEALRREVAELRIEINQAKRQREVEQITETDYFQALQSKARRLRDKK